MMFFGWPPRFSGTALPISSSVDAQTATTYEIGTRGRRPDLTWDLSLYRADIKNELQCLRTSPFSLCTVINANRTVHQGVEAGLGVAFLTAAGASMVYLAIMVVSRSWLP